jgi:hypothetical protein
MVAFPYENYIPIALHRPLLAPVLQSYLASTESLERFFNDTLEAQRPKGLDVMYAIDNVGVWPVDGVPTVTRVPLIFDYLRRNFAVVTGSDSQDGHYILEPRSTPRAVVVEDMPFSSERWSDSSGVVRLPAPTACGLIRVEMNIVPSIRKSFFRPSGVDLAFRRGNVTVLKVPVKPIELNRTFGTYIALVSPANFHKLFESTIIPIPNTVWDNVAYDRTPTDRLSARPRAVEISRIQCVDREMFIAADPAVEDTEEEALFDRDVMQGAAQAGYAVLVPQSAAFPRLTVRFNEAKSLRFRDYTVNRITNSYRMPLPPSISEQLGLAIVNPQTNLITVQIKLESGGKEHTAAVRVPGNQQTSKFLAELLPQLGKELLSGNLVIDSDSPFSVIGLKIFGPQFHILPVEPSTIEKNGPIVLAQFVLHGGWSTALILSNPNSASADGRVDLFSSNGRPMFVNMNGSTSNTFKYSIPAGARYVLRPGSSTRGGE